MSGVLHVKESFCNVIELIVHLVSIFPEGKGGCKVEPNPAITVCSSYGQLLHKTNLYIL